MYIQPPHPSIRGRNWDNVVVVAIVEDNAGSLKSGITKDDKIDFATSHSLINTF